MSRYLLLTILLALCCSSLRVASQSKFKKNDSWLYRLETNLHFLPDNHQYVEKIYRVTITAVNKDGTADALATLESAQVKTSNINYNTTDPETYKIEPNMMEDMLLLHQPLEFKIFANDSIGVPTNLDAVATAVGRNVGLDPQMSATLSYMWKLLPSHLQGVFASYPAKAVIGYQWKAGDWSYQVAGVEKEEIMIRGSQEDHQPDSLHRVINTSYTLSRNKGNVLAFNYHNSAAPGQPVNSSQVTGTLLPAGTQLPPADTAFYKALLQLSYFSNSLDAKGEADSAKVAGFLALNVPRYGNNMKFKLALLGLNRGRSEHMYELYKDALQQVPSYALADRPSDLFNKLQNTVHINVDSAMVLVKLLSVDENSLNSWLDQSFSQYLRNNVFDTANARKVFKERGLSEKRIEEIMEEGRQMPIMSQAMLNRLTMEKDSILQVSVKPMSLWNKAMHTTDTAILKSIAAEIANASPAEMTLGKAARYELMVHDILRNAKLDKAADALLDKTLENLKNNQADTAFWTAHPALKDKKSANKNILAHAYYLKYKQTNPQDKKTALNYLGLAAANSPKDNKEKAYESFYDRVFLSSEEDYSPKFAEELTALGKPEEAMRVLSRQLMAKPDMLESARNLFEKNFPDKSFQDYFRNVLLKEWEQAPDFTLSGLNKETYRLSDYKGKWLLLDFWGTWCSPCREDLPNVNRLATEINDGKHPGNALLTISCREPLERARDFVAENKYVFAAAHSDNKIEEMYKVRGYPTKVLVSPEGKMLDLQFGTDYAAILQTYSSLYFKEDKTAVPAIKVDNKKKD